jgi:hypothetical protein
VKWFLFFLITFFATSVNHVQAQEINSPIILTEFMAHPSSDSEWVEFKNISTETISLTGWVIDDAEEGSSPFFIPTGQEITAGEYVIFEIGTRLNNSGDTIRLLDAQNVVIDSVTYASATIGMPWARNDHGNWEETAVATPSAPNIFELDTLPQITTSISPTPSPTPQVEVTPTSTPTPQINFEMPGSVQVEEAFEIDVLIENLLPNTAYLVKSLGGFTLEEVDAVRTLGQNEVNWLAWNASWEQFPILTTDQSGSGFVTLTAKFNETEKFGTAYFFLRLREQGKTRNVD